MMESSASALDLGEVVTCCWDSGKAVGDAGCFRLGSCTTFGFDSGCLNNLARLSMDSTMVSSLTTKSGPKLVQDVVCEQVTGIQ